LYEWKLFSNFKNWMIEQDWKNKELDKDLLIIGNKTYSPNTCMFVTSTINKLIGVHGSSKNTYAIGVSWSKRNNKYRADCDVQGKQRYLGLYLTEEEASQVYRACKKEVIICVANQQSDLKLKSALLNIANNLSSHQTVRGTYVLFIFVIL